MQLQEGEPAPMDSRRDVVAIIGAAAILIGEAAPNTVGNCLIVGLGGSALGYGAIGPALSRLLRP